MSTSYLWEMTPEERLRKLRREAQSSTATQSQSDFQLSDKHKQELLDIVEGRDTFSYDAQSDPMYQQYREQYTRNARGAAEDVYANATARSGGFGNSYANVAAQQTYNTQMEGVTDIIPELEALAYGRHQTQQEQKLTAYDQLQALYDADHEELLSRMYLYAYNGTQEGLWDGASGAEEALRAKFPEMTDDDFATIKAEMYDGGYWKGVEKSGAPSGGYTAEDGTVVSQANVNEIYAYLRSQAAGGKDEEGNEIAPVDIFAKKGTLTSDLAKILDENGNRKYTDAEIEAAFEEMGSYVEMDEVENVEKTHTDNATLIEKAMAGISDEFYNPVELGISALDWENMPIENRESVILDLAEEMVATGQVQQAWYYNFINKYVIQSIENCLDEEMTIDVVSETTVSLLDYIEELHQSALTEEQRENIKVEIANVFGENDLFALISRQMDNYNASVEDGSYAYSTKMQEVGTHMKAYRRLNLLKKLYNYETSREKIMREQAEAQRNIAKKLGAP